jgi:hypothetical protein
MDHTRTWPVCAPVAPEQIIDHSEKALALQARIAGEAGKFDRRYGRLSAVRSLLWSRGLTP